MVKGDNVVEKIVAGFTPFNLKVSLVIPLSVCHTTVVMNLDPNRDKLDIGSTNNLLINVYLYSHYLYTWYCVDFQNWELVIMLKFFQALFSLLHK